jgi:hypothetical protein
MANTFKSVRKQISYDPCHRTQRQATSAQLDYLAQLILDCEGKPGFRWDFCHPESFTVHRASVLIDSLTRIKAGMAS